MNHEGDNLEREAKQLARVCCTRGAENRVVKPLYRVGAVYFTLLNSCKLPLCEMESIDPLKKTHARPIKRKTDWHLPSYKGSFNRILNEMAK